MLRPCIIQLLLIYNDIGYAFYLLLQLTICTVGIVVSIVAFHFGPIEGCAFMFHPRCYAFIYRSIQDIVRYRSK